LTPRGAVLGFMQLPEPHSPDPRGLMGIRFNVYPMARLVAYTVDETATPEDARTFLDAVLAHRHYQRGFDFLGDRSAGGEPDASYIHAIALEVRNRVDRLAPCRWGVVVPTLVGFGMVRMWAILTQETGVEIAPFLSAAEASEWVGANTAERHVIGEAASGRAIAGEVPATKEPDPAGDPHVRPSHLVRCWTCGRCKVCPPADLLRYVHRGWPRCCGQTMAYFAETEQPSLADLGSRKPLRR